MGRQHCVTRGLCRKRPEVLYRVTSHWLEINFHLFLSHFCKELKKASIYLQVCALLLARQWQKSGEAVGDYKSL